MILTPAYGRDYKTKKEFEQDFNEGKDFKLLSFNGDTYCNKEDILSLNVDKIKIRFKKLTKFDFINVEKN